MNKNESKYFKSAEKMHNALITLLDSKGFEYITIKEICETAGVNRSTFYLHYDNVNDLLQETVEAVYKDFFGRFGAEGETVSCYPGISDAISEFCRREQETLLSDV